ncbi:hypothetical protein ACOI1C_05320 [Bacillus sp. DJP31]|uniref:hypothetical protein n=1 Tax=Bacillus sp. DJP31 TaxID=3409789 RepID=UPI003BB6138A
MNRVVSINEIEHAFDNLLHTINRIEEKIESQTEIEINEMRIAQLEKISYLNASLTHVVSRTKGVSGSPFQLVLVR